MDIKKLEKANSLQREIWYLRAKIKEVREFNNQDRCTSVTFSDRFLKEHRDELLNLLGVFFKKKEKEFNEL